MSGPHRHAGDRCTRGCTSDGCRQGRRPCPTPDACRGSVDSDARPRSSLSPGLLILLWVCIVLGAAFGWHLLSSLGRLFGLVP